MQLTIAVFSMCGIAPRILKIDTNAPRFFQTRLFLRKQLSLSDMGKDQPRSQGPPFYVEKVPRESTLFTCLLDFSRFQRCD